MNLAFEEVVEWEKGNKVKNVGGRKRAISELNYSDSVHIR